MSASHKESTTKIIVTPTADMKKSPADFAKAVADKLGVCPEDVIVLGGVSSLTFTTIPAELTAARAKFDAEAKEKAEADAKAVADAEAVAAAKVKAEAAVKAKAEADAAKEIEAATKAELAKHKADEKKAAHA